MAGAGEIASAYLTIYPKLEGKSVVSEVERGLGSAGTSAGRTFSDNASAAMSTGMGAAGTAGGNALAEGFGVSRSPVRAALEKLYQKGYLYQTDRHFYVKEFSAKEYRDLSDLSRMIEPYAAGEAALKLTDKQLQQLFQTHLSL